MIARAEARVRSIPVITRANSRFDRYRTEPSHEVRRTDVKEDKTLAQLKEAFRNFNFETKGKEKSDKDIAFNYEKALLLVKTLNYNARDIENFGIAILEFRDYPEFGFCAGIFLSALINNGSERDYVINTKAFGDHVEIHCFGFRNTKNIIVNGGLGVSIGDFMESGSIVINGNAGISIGQQMKDGIITINGNARVYVGFYMEGGKVIVNGNAGKGVGHVITGGEIHLNGTYESISELICGGRIYHKGKLIAGKEDGELL